MTTYRVTVPRLNQRKYAVTDTSDKSNVVAVVTEGYEFEGEWALTNALGKWCRDKAGYYYWGGGIAEAAADHNHIDHVTVAPFNISNCWWLSDFKVAEFWQQGITGKGIKVAVLDSGISLPHPDLNIEPGNCWDVTNSPTGFTDNQKYGHGTHCAGIIKASNNGYGVTGVAYDCDLYVCKVSHDPGYPGGEPDDDIYYLKLAIEDAIARGIEIISISIAIPQDAVGIQQLLQAALEEHNILIITAGGNQFPDYHFEELLYPAFYEECLSVGALQAKNQVSPVTIVSRRLKLLAPGIDIKSTSLNQGYRELSGSSQATPFVAGIAALTIQYLKLKKKKYTAKGVYKLICEAGDPVEGLQAKIINPLNIINLINNGTETFL